MATPIRDIHSVLTARMVLRMREHNRQAMAGGTTAALGQGTVHSLVFAPIPAPVVETRVDEQDDIEMDVSSWWAEERRRNNDDVEDINGGQEGPVFRRSSADHESNGNEVARSDTADSVVLDVNDRESKRESTTIVAL
ncbi:hypothetical protein BV22DRAFT_432781 [Leucogyrophana mollusca]|uniref:Uncharacterized protein n=1 Tax=Leucogyrophana mollusca TaxID=85980 RepID=A0ACB8BKR2_9AGAM|nr:hypothetical protein BV22DRAFT_432781 [Leucogyrophana mollusca]